MKRIGIIGGLGPEATADYYKEIIKRFNVMGTGESLQYPEILIYSVNMAKFIGYLQRNELANATSYISSCIEKIASAGADFAAISANTPHLLFDEIQKQCTIPVISIVEACLAEAQRLHFKRVGLIGTKFTMRASFYANAFAKKGISLAVPNEIDIEAINEKLFTELELGIFKTETRDMLLQIVRKMIDNEGIDALILGCTEFPIMFTESHYLGIPFMNTTGLHVDKIVEMCVAPAN